jgi:hypothetical protein
MKKKERALLQALNNIMEDIHILYVGYNSAIP